MFIGISNVIQSSMAGFGAGGSAGIPNFLPVIFDIGQSNSIGRAESERYVNIAGYAQQPADIDMYYKTAYGAADNGTWQQADAYTNCKEPDAAGAQRTFGAYLPLAVQLRDYLQRKVYVIAAGDGGTALANGVTANTWDPEINDSCFDRATLQYFNVAITKLQVANPGVPILVFINWYQGESDATDADATAAYSTNFPLFVTALRASHVLLADAYMFITKLYFAKSANETTINTFFQTYRDANSSICDIIDISDQKQKDELTVGEIGGYIATSADDNHLSYLGQITRATRIFNKITALLPLVTSSPNNTVIPSISGTAKVGNLLTGNKGTWEGLAITYTHSWTRDNIAIAGATSSTYTLIEDDYNTAIRYVPLATNPGGSSSEASLATSAVLPANPVNTIAPAITGIAQEDEVLTCSLGTWTGQGSISYARQWKRDGVNISGETASTYLLVLADVGAVITCNVTATNAGGSTSQISNSTSSIAAAGNGPVNTVAPVISGTQNAGFLLSCTTGTWTNSPTGYTYQWKRDTVNISGATSSTYTLIEDDVTTSITCAVTATNLSGNSTALSNALTINALTMPTFFGKGTRSAGVGTVTPTIPAGCVANHIMILKIETSNEAIATPSGWTLVDVAYGVGTAGAVLGAVRITQFWKRHTGTESNPVISDTAEHKNAQIFAYAGCPTSGVPFDVVSGGTDAVSNTTGIFTGVTTTIHNTLIDITVVSDLDSTSARWGGVASNMACAGVGTITNQEDQSSNTGGGGGIAVWTAPKPNTGATGDFTATATNAQIKAWMVIAFKPN